MAVVRRNEWLGHFRRAYRYGVHGYRVAKRIEPYIRRAYKYAKAANGARMAANPKYNGRYPRGTASAKAATMPMKEGSRLNKAFGKRFGNGRLGGKFSKPRGNPKKTTAYKFRSGVTTTIEAGKILASNEVQYVGHITHPQQTVLTQMWTALVKRLLYKTGVVIKDLNQALPSQSTDIINIQYQPEPAGTFTSYALPVYTGISVSGIAAILMGPTNPWNTNPPTFAMQDFQFSRISYETPIFNSKMNSAYIDMDNCRVKYNIKSSLKMQNRSVTEAADHQMDDIDNVPLYGKMYAGPGTGARLITRNYGPQQFYGDTTYGLIEAEANLLSDTINEPPSPFLFQEVKKFSKVSIQPGDIKTSIISSAGSMKWNEMWVKLMYYYPNVTTVKRHIGKFEFLALEKILDATSIPEGINIAMELEWTGMFDVTTPTVNPTSVTFIKAYLT